MTLGGVVELEMTAAEVERALSEISLSGMELQRVTQIDDLTVSFSVRYQELDRLSSLCKRRGYSLRILGKHGFFDIIEKIVRRKVLVAGIGFLLMTALFLPTRIFFVQVIGNEKIPKNQILLAAEECGICFGASRAGVRSERVKNALLGALPQLQWAGVNTRGCTAVISVRERSAAVVPEQSVGVSSIVADRDGYILSCVVTQGTAQVQPGQTVRKGQTLVSGYTECGICIQATRAKGEIIAQTHRNLTMLSPEKCLYRQSIASVSRRWSLLLGKKRIFFWKDSGISDTGCGRMSREYALTLPGGFRLPIGISIDTYQHFTVAEGDAYASAEEQEKFAIQHLKSQMVSGVIQRSETEVTRGGGVARLEGSYLCTEVIGKEKPEQIGESHGKTS